MFLWQASMATGIKGVCHAAWSLRLAVWLFYFSDLQESFILEGGATCLFPAVQPQNNHTETILFTSLLGPLALASY